MKLRKPQHGIALGYLTAGIVVAMLIGAMSLRMAPSGNAVEATKAQAAATSISGSAEGLRAALMNLKLTVGNTLDPQILDGNYLTSVTAQWAPLLLDPLTGADALGSWNLNANDTLTVPNTTTKVPVARLTVTLSACKALNKQTLHPAADGSVTQPVLASASNGSGSDYTVSNIPTFNGGYAVDTFCVPGINQGVVYAGLIIN